MLRKNSRAAAARSITGPLDIMPPLEAPIDPSNFNKDHFALGMDHFAECVRQNKPPYTPGEEGPQDQRSASWKPSASRPAKTSR